MNRTRERAEGIAIQVVGRFVENDDVRAVPHRRRDDDLDLLPAGKRSHASVGAKLLVQADVFEVLLDVSRR